MQIKHNYLQQHLQKKLISIYWLIGQDAYLLEESLKSIKSHIKNNYDCEEKFLTIESANDWAALQEEANSYSLFSEMTLLNIVHDKKSLDSAGKKVITNYLKDSNTRSTLIIRSPNVPLKQMQWLTSANDALVVVHYSLTKEAMNQWIGEQLKKLKFTYEENIPGLIYQYTQGNMLACAQVIEKISLSTPQGGSISHKEALEHVFNQCEHSLFELVDACLLGQLDKSIQILRHAANNKTEATLVLWVLAQEIRHLVQLHYLVEQNTDFKTACSQLKIWPQKIPLYQSAYKRMSYPVLKQLIRHCYTIDEFIKTNQNVMQVWNNLEQVILALCQKTQRICSGMAST